ncbi:class I glutamine amidotransferase-like protein [Meira miltonrushii]|uniref:Class I glutamine amidotransferase-like protein n=1 Tax=Meira miltonrushii TaxID=1280837 RepID=A0A316V905_9BASI|nr:class I glutamine amidotransferase-like protein [Meira miltonrushii]PWN33724.1 class I glutamine amidotransferase-like protein [Meira miltonrushii]
MVSVPPQVRLISFVALFAFFQSASAIQQLLAFDKISEGAYRHESIPTAIDVITRLGNGQIVLNTTSADVTVANDKQKWNTTVSDDDSLWEDPNYLSQFDAIAFVMTADKDDGSTTLLSPQAKVNFAKYIQNGGGFIGFHVACGCLYDTPFYGRLVGAYFDYHPEIQPVGIKALTNNNPSTSKFPASFQINEEVYHYRTDPRLLPSAPIVLLSNSTVFNDPQAANRTRSDGPPPRPLAWVRSGNLLDAPSTPLGQGMDDPEYGPKYSGGPGRMFYTSLGHLNETWQQIPMQAHVAGGISWVMASPTCRSRKGDSPLKEQSSPSDVPNSAIRSRRYHSKR